MILELRKMLIVIMHLIMVVVICNLSLNLQHKNNRYIASLFGKYFTGGVIWCHAVNAKQR